MGVQVYRLWPRRPRDGLLSLGLSCDEEGLCLASYHRLVTAALNREGRRFYRAQSLGEINAALSAGYGVSVNAAPLYPAIAGIAEYMTRGEWTLATLAAVYLGLPELPDQAAAHRLLKTTDTVWDPEKHPRWPAESPEGQGGRFRPLDSSEGGQLSPVSNTGKETSAAEERAKQLEVVRRDRSLFRVLRVLRRALGIVDAIEDAKRLSDMIDDINDLINLSKQKSPELQRSLDPPKDLEELRADKEFRSFPSFQAFKDYYGSAGEGYEWHHIVEQSAGFPVEQVNNTENIIRVPKFIHEELNGIYSRPLNDQGKQYRDILHKESFGMQRAMGLSYLHELGVTK